ncbi:uncharacterized protein APUU_10034A [Aspergillus puulaauensis]|uniref:Major facilitator superfamily (MFS) profile domain-containing protein n=1 Tax=Aspergillus puulaauensis TaxID=1220207 RepID=A0A7R7X996_9EURO|nr:uncharacterized protein APUU_10034A [Aspergillus puulaauensis]BCS17206.1 hypothetical protein APUU_10034A [Aspergillus puulaauensis]
MGLISFRKPDILSEMTWRVLGIYLFVSFGSFNFGFDLAWWSSCLGLQQFADDYGVSPGPGQANVIPAAWQSAGTGTPNAGMAIGCIVGGYCNAYIGRKMTIIVLAVVSIVGVVLQCAVPSYWAVIAGRTINGISMGMEANVIPTYSAELAPAAIRGSLVNFYQWWQIVGNIVSAGCIYGTSKTLSGHWQYKPVMIAQAGVPLILLCGVWFMPESPRWLLMKNRRSDAQTALASIRKGKSSPSEVYLELLVIESALEEQRSLAASTTYFDCFRGANLRRTLIAVLVQVMQQIQGNSFMNNYLVVFLQRIGIQNGLQIYLAQNATQLGGVTLSFYFTDKIGRRPLLIVSSFFMAVLMWTVAGLGAYTEIRGSSKAQGCVGAILIYQAIAAGCWGSCTWITTSEAAAAVVREKTIMTATFVSFCMVLLVTYINPFVQDPGYGDLGARVGFVYGGCSLLALAWAFFFLPELKGRSLEELDEMFARRIPTRKFGDYVSPTGTDDTKAQNIAAESEQVTK